ncbi:MAG: glycosyltransferase family 1 protein [Candidatus Hydrogenedentes bacterium]|nr:glycosyltransferase family 1 protein [Candidatus Hydrogenedentota bacterium]
MSLYHSAHGHEVRTLAIEGDADYLFDPRETTSDVIARVSKDWPPDLLMCWLPELFPPPRAVEDSPIKTVAIVSDWNIYFPQIEANLARYDLALTDKPGARTLRLRGAKAQYYAPLYSHLSTVHRKLDVKKDIDILFVGNLNHAIHRERARCLERIAALAGEFHVVIATDVYDEEYARLLNRARIVFNYSVRGELNLRTFEAMACGALLFLEHHNEEAGGLLQNRIDAVMYTEEDMIGLLRHYLAEPEQRRQAARAGRRKCAAFAGELRLDGWINWIARQPRGPRAFKTLPEEDRLLADILQNAASLVIGQQDLARDDALACLARFGDRPDFLITAGLAQLHDLTKLDGEPRRLETKEVMRCFNKASSIAPDAITPWLNLAVMCRQAGSVEAETHCLENALSASSCEYGGLLMGVTSDPYYIAWRKGLALGAIRPELLWAAAACRLSELDLIRGRAADACARARQSIAWEPSVAFPHRIWAIAESQLGRIEEAASILEDALPLTAFDADYRMDLVRALALSGQVEKAEAVAAESMRLLRVCSNQQEHADAFDGCVAEILRGE